jgi:Sulfatase
MDRSRHPIHIEPPHVEAFGASTAFGGLCSMPAAEQLAEGGLKFNRFHTTAVCSPTRAALMTITAAGLLWPSTAHRGT